MKQTYCGIDVLGQNPARFLGKSKKLRVAALCHPSSVDKKGRHLVHILEKNSQLSALFGPQHGIFGETQDNMIEWQDFKDKSGRPHIFTLRKEKKARSFFLKEYRACSN